MMPPLLLPVFTVVLMPLVGTFVAMPDMAHAWRTDTIIEMWHMSGALTRPTLRVVESTVTSLELVRRLLLSATAVVLVGCASAAPPAIDLTPSAARGLAISQQNGCASCHGSDFGGGTGPTWQGIIGQQVAFRGGSSGVVDRDYLIEAIKYPDRKLRVGYSVIMPYNNLTDEQISDVVDYIEALSN
jgi:cytochrome c551/c552